MSSRIDPSLYPRLHEQLADRFGTVVFKLLPDIADALLAHAAEGLDANVAAKLTDTARLLREEAAVRAEIALENFVGIDLGSMSEESSLPVTVTDLGQPVAGADIGLLEQILARELASTVRSSFGGSYLNYLRRLESLAETPLRDDQHPLGARALYLSDKGKDTLYRIHGTNEPEKIGQAVSSGCIRMRNIDVVDLYNRVPVGATVIVR